MILVGAGFTAFPGRTTNPISIPHMILVGAGFTAFPGRPTNPISIPHMILVRAGFTAFPGRPTNPISIPHMILVGAGFSCIASNCTAIHRMISTISRPTIGGTTTEPTTENHKRKNVSIKPSTILSKEIIVEVILPIVVLVPATGEEPAREARNTLILAQEVLEPEGVSSIAVIITSSSVIRWCAHHIPHRGEGFTDLLKSIALAVSNNLGTDFFAIARAQFLFNVLSSLCQALRLLASPLHQHAGRDGLHGDSVAQLGRLLSRGISTLRLLDSLLHHVQVGVQSVTGHGVRYWLYHRTAGTTVWGVLLCQERGC